MPGCCAFGCNNKHGCGVSFHAFTFSRPAICQQWTAGVRRDKWMPNNRTVICADHFEDKCFDRTGQTVRLKPEAVPTIFAYPDRLKKVQRVRPAPKVRTVPQVESSLDNDTPDQDPVELSPADSAARIIESSDLDHTYTLRVTPNQQDKVHQLRQRHRVLMMKLRSLRQRNKRILRKVNSLQEVVDDLKSKFLLSANCESMLQRTYGNVLGGIIGRKKRATKTSGHTKAHYSPELRSFALTLQFYSSKAYNYVRKTFDLCLPSPSTLRKWYSSIDAEPGFCTEAFDALKAKVDPTSPLVCAMMIDEMSIRKHIEWDGKRFRGYVDIGANIDDDDLPVATDALVFMLVCVNGSWKVPIAYFLIAGLSVEERANLVQQALLKLDEIGITVASLTFDGPSCHFSMARALGADLELPDPIPSFPHPSRPQQRVQLILDICHMMKLIRNALAELGILIDGMGREINWKYVEYLHHLQQREGIRAGNKLRNAHMQWRNQKMKVNLAVQTISSSVADAIEFCTVDLKLPQFVGSEATVRFMRVFDRLFDLLNSRNPLGKGYKAAMKPSNEAIWKPFMEEACSYILQLSDRNGTLLYKSKRKTGFVGFYISTLSLLQIYNHYVICENKLKYILTYKFSQDHLELFFSAVRARGARNNNPNAAQFKSAFKRLLIRHEVECTTGNATAQDNTKILHVLTDSDSRGRAALDIVDIYLIRRYDMSTTLDYEESEETPFPNYDCLSQYSENVVAYIAGYVVKMVYARMRCEKCLSALHSSDSDTSNRPLKLFQRKTRGGGLVCASVGVEKVCRSAERCVRTIFKNRNGISNQPALVSSICLTVLEDTCTSSVPVFPSLADHMFDTAPDQNHVYRLITTITSCYLQVRLNHLAKCQTEKISGDPIRRKLTKLILFKNQ